MDNNDERFMKRCYELAISAGKKGYDTFGAVLVCDGKILEEAENTADYENRIFGHAEFNDEGMHVFEWWGGEYRPLEELIAEMDEVKRKQK